MNIHPTHTSDPKTADRIWLSLGGTVLPIRRTGELQYKHTFFVTPLRINGRRNDVPAKLLSRINQLLKHRVAKDGL